MSRICQNLMLMASVLFLAGGCAAFKGYPDRSSDPESDLAVLKKYFEQKMLAEYDQIPAADLQGRKAKRDEIINGRLAAIDLRFNLFQQDLYKEGIGLNVGTDFVTIGLGAAGALVSGGTSQILSGVSGGVVGAKQSIDKNAFFERTMPALLAEMIAQRKTVLITIVDGLPQDVNTYPLNQALVNLEEYYQAGTIAGAVANIVQSSGEKSARADVVLFPERPKDFFAAERQVRVSEILTKIDGLTGAQAIELEGSVPVTTPEIERLVALRDPGSRRLTNQTGDFAKQILKMRVTMGSRSDQALQKWEAAIEEVAGGS